MAAYNKQMLSKQAQETSRILIFWIKNKLCLINVIDFCILS